MLGRDDQDPLFLDAEEAQESVLEQFVAKASTPTAASASSPGNA